jgi:hypothetical protein
VVWKLIRHRRAQALAIAALAALITACAAFAPLYDRAMQQALVQERLSAAPVQISGLRLTARSSTAGPDAVAAAVPDDLRPYLREPTPSGRVAVTRRPGATYSPTGPLTWREGFCDHVTFRAGACPARALEIAVSEADAANFGWKVGTRIPVFERISDPTLDPDDAPRPTLRVVGVYGVQRGDYWFGRLVSGRSGSSDPDTSQPQTDDLLTDAATLTGPDAPGWLAPTVELDFPLDRPKVGVDELLRLGPVLTTYLRQGQVTAGDLSQKSAPIPFSGLPDIAEEVAGARDQAHVIVPLLMVQLGLLALVVLWLVLGAATEQRRPEIALARLRGRGARGAARLLLGELLPVALAGVLAGTVVALGLSWLARHVFLPGSTRFELGTGFAVAVAAATAAVVLVTLTVVVQVVREPVSALLRRVPTQRRGWGLGVADAMVIAASAMAAVAFATGGLTGPIALAAPSLLALAVGLVLAHLVVPVAAATGRRLLARGRLTSGVSILQLARRPATRRVIAIVTVATALLVFSADALQVGLRNRDAAAQQQNAAPLSVEVSGTDLVGVRDALEEVDPDGRAVTPVVSISPPGDPQRATMAVVPDEFRRIALFPGQSRSEIPWQELDAPPVEPIRMVGTSVRFRVAHEVVVSGSDVQDHPAFLGLRLTVADGRSQLVRIARLASGEHSARTVTADLPCEDGCVLAALSVLADAGHSTQGRVELGPLTTRSGHGAAGTTYELGGVDQWQPADEDLDAGTMAPDPAVDRADLLAVDVNAEGGIELRMPHAALPERIPALVAGPLPDDAVGTGFESRRLDGLARGMEARSRLPRVPGGVPATALVNLDVLSRDVAKLDPLATIRLLFADDDPAEVARVAAALADRNIQVTTPTTVGGVRDELDASIAAWSLALALVVGGAGLAIDLLVLLVVAATTWRLRAPEVTALRMSGVSGASVVRIAAGEQLPVVLLAVVAGSVCGVVGAHLAMPSVPLFASDPAVSTLDLATSWGAAAAAALTAGFLLTACVLLIGRALARRATLERVRESM